MKFNANSYKATSVMYEIDCMTILTPFVFTLFRNLITMFLNYEFYEGTLVSVENLR